MKKFGITIERISKAIILSVWSLMVLFVFLVSLVRTIRIEHYMDIYFDDDSLIINVLVLIGFTLLLCLLTDVYKKNYEIINAFWNKYKNIIMLAEMLIVAGFLIWWISFMKFVPSGDQSDCFSDARALMSGNINSWVKGYLSFYPFQNILVLLDVVLLSIFKDNAYLVFQYINVIFYLIACVALYKSAKKKNGFTWFVILFYYPTAIYCIYCYTNIMGLAFITIAVAFLMAYFDDKKVKNLLGCALFAAITAVVKSNYSIVVIAIVIFLLLDFLCKKNLKSILGVLLVIISCFMLSFGEKVLVEKVTGYPMAEGMPKISWVAMGLQNNRDNWGWWNNWHTYTYYTLDYDAQALKEKSYEYIFKDRMPYFIENPVHGFTFFSKKLASEWCDPAFESLTIQELKVDERAVEVNKTVIYPNNRPYVIILNLIQTICYAGLLLYVISKWAKFKSFDINELIWAVAMIGAFLFYMFWEAKSEYVNAFFFMQLPYVVIGWKEFINFIMDNKLKSLSLKNDKKLTKSK